MSKVINFKPDFRSTPEYRKELGHTADKLAEIGDSLIGLMINLATIGKWKEWSDNMQNGEKFEFSEEILKDTGDENVDEIASLMDELSRVKFNFEKRLSKEA